MLPIYTILFVICYLVKFFSILSLLLPDWWNKVVYILVRRSTRIAQTSAKAGFIIFNLGSASLRIMGLPPNPRWGAITILTWSLLATMTLGWGRPWGGIYRYQTHWRVHSDSHTNIQFLPRDVMRKRGLCYRPVSVRPSVCPSRWCILSTRLKLSSNFFISPAAPSF